MKINYSDIKWEHCNKEVLKLQRKIIVAWNNKDFKKVHNLQELLVNKFETRALAVRKVTTNKGSKTPGIDNVIIKTDVEKINLINQLKDLKNYKATPVKRVMIPKANGKLRPLGIPSIYDRCVQAMYHMALDPIAEEVADPRSYGFRKGRSTQDLQQYIRSTINQREAARYILDGDIKGFFDNISHDWIINNIPINKYILNQWLKAGYFSDASLHKTLKGVPQGGIISPTIANMVLDGLQNVIIKVSKQIKKRESATLRKQKLPSDYNPKIHYARYADDFIITAAKKEYFDEILPTVIEFLAIRGVELNQEKTKIFNIKDGFNFVGFNFKKYNTTRRASKEILLVKPANKNILKVRDKIRLIFKKYKDPKALISALNPIIRGWVNYYKHTNASRTFYSLDYYIIRKTIQWIRFLKRSRGMKAAINQFFKRKENSKWNFVYIDLKSNKIFKLFQAGSIKIRTHIQIRNLNPYSIENEEYYLKRSEKEWQYSISEFSLKLYKRQKGLCPVCKNTLININEEELEVHHIQPREFKGNSRILNLLLLHKTCHQSVTNCKDPELLAKYITQGIVKPLSERYKKLLDKSNKI